MGFLGGYLPLVMENSEIVVAFPVMCVRCSPGVGDNQLEIVGDDRVVVTDHWSDSG